MKRIYQILAIIVMASMASAAVYEATAPSDAQLTFTREIPYEHKMMTMIECGTGYTTRCDMGEMSGDALNRRILNMNQENISFDGCMYFEINCSAGLDDPAGGIEDFVSITYTDPNGTAYSCNNFNCIERISPTTIAITPPMDPYTFPPDMVEVYSDIEVVFVPNAYGKYCLTAWVDHPPR